MRRRLLSLLVVPLLLLTPSAAWADDEPLTIGAVQGTSARSPLADNSTLHDVRGVVTQRTLARTATGAAQHGFFLQSRAGTDDGDPASSDGIFVFLGASPTLAGGYEPVVGDEIVVRARVSEFFSYTQLSGALLVTRLSEGTPLSEVRVDNAVPPASLAAANLFWERHEGMQLRVRSGAGVIAGRNVFSGTADSEIWVVDREDPLLGRPDPYSRRVFRDAHPLDNVPGTVDDGNGNRILLGSTGVKATAGDSGVLLPPAKTFDLLSGDAVGGLAYSFNKYAIQPATTAFTPGADPSRNNPPRPANRSTELAISTYNVENLYDFRDDPFDGCDFTGNTGCPGVNPPFDYVPASEAAYRDKLDDLADQIIRGLHSPDLILAQEAEDQDLCTVAGNALACGAVNNADGQPDTLQDLALTIKSKGGPAYAATSDRTGADARGITAAFLFRPDRLSLAAPVATDSVLGAAPQVSYRGEPLPGNTEVANPKALNAVLPADVDRSTGVDGLNVYTRAPQVALFDVRTVPGAPEQFPLWAISNHFSSGPDTRVGQRTEQAAYGAAITTAIGQGARIAYGGDLNTFPRPDGTGDQLAPLYEAGLHNLWDDLVAEAPSSAYSYVFDGSAQTLDNLFVSEALHDDLIEMRAAHINADWAAADEANGSMGTSDHDPQIARFQSRAALSVANASTVEGDSGTTSLVFPVTLSRPLSRPLTICASTLPGTAWAVVDFEPYAACKVVPAGGPGTTFAVQVKGDRWRELDERLTFVITGLANIRLADARATGTITNDD